MLVSNTSQTHTSVTREVADHDAAGHKSGELSQVQTGKNLFSSNVGFKAQKTNSANLVSQLKLNKCDLSDEDAITKDEISLSAKLADYPYHRGKLPDGWAQQKNLAQQIARENGFNFYPNSGMIESKHGLTAYVVSDGKEIGLIFGGTTSGKQTGNILTRMLGNINTTRKQNAANIDSAVYQNIPKSYTEAVKLTESLIQITDLNVSTFGHSKGGGESAYAAAMAGTAEYPIRSVNYCSAELSTRMIENIEKKHGANCDKAVSEITNIKIKGDVVPNMHKILNNITNIGKSYTVTPSSFDTPLGYHNNFAKHVEKYVNRSVSNNPEDANPDLSNDKASSSPLTRFLNNNLFGRIKDRRNDPGSA